MNQDDIERLIRKIRSNGHEVWIAGPVSPEAIAGLESLIGSQLPSSYKAFLAAYGGLGIYDSFVSGILDNDPSRMEVGGLYADTMFLREDASEIPSSLLIIDDSGSEEYS